MRLGDEIDQSWYKIDFRISRWACPHDLPAGLIQDIADATEEVDSILASAAKLVDKYAYGIHSDPKRYIPYSQLNHLKLDFESIEDLFEIAKAGFAYRWQQILKDHRDEIRKLPEELNRHLQGAEGAYGIELHTVEVKIAETMRQFLEQTHH